MKSHINSIDFMVSFFRSFFFYQYILKTTVMSQHLDMNPPLFLPWSLSRRSEQSCSSGMSQPVPNHPDSHQHSHSKLWLVLHCPWPLHAFGHPSRVQCLPFHPEEEKNEVKPNWKKASNLKKKSAKKANILHTWIWLIVSEVMLTNIIVVFSYDLYITIIINVEHSYEWWWQKLFTTYTNYQQIPLIRNGKKIHGYYKHSSGLHFVQKLEKSAILTNFEYCIYVRVDF